MTGRADRSRSGFTVGGKIGEQPAVRVCLISMEIFAWGKHGGFGRATRIIGRELARRGVQVFAVVPRRGDQRPVELLDRITVLGFEPARPWQAVPLLRSCDADIYHSEEPSFTTYLAQRAMPDRKHVVTLRDTRELGDWLTELAVPLPQPAAGPQQFPLRGQHSGAAGRAPGRPGLLRRRVSSGQGGPQVSPEDGAGAAPHARCSAGRGTEVGPPDGLLSRPLGPAQAARAVPGSGTQVPPGALRGAGPLPRSRSTTGGCESAMPAFPTSRCRAIWTSSARTGSPTCCQRAGSW